MNRDARRSRSRLDHRVPRARQSGQQYVGFDTRTQPANGQLLARPSGLIGLVFISIAIGGSSIGAYVPHFIVDELSPPVFGIDTTPKIDVLGRLAQIIGGVCGFYVALRAIWLWCMVGVIAVAVYLFLAAANYVTGGPPG
jgi:hypothetical protein